MSVSAPLIAEARGTTKRVARTFSLACRLLPRDSAMTSICSTSSFAPSTTS